jgi:hypothetical protein
MALKHDLDLECMTLKQHDGDYDIYDFGTFAVTQNRTLPNDNSRKSQHEEILKR